MKCDKSSLNRCASQSKYPNFIQQREKFDFYMIYYGWQVQKHSSFIKYRTKVAAITFYLLVYYNAIFTCTKRKINC